MHLIRGWKEAEKFLGISRSTRQRWEKILPSPKIKVSGAKSGGVTFISGELLMWPRDVEQKHVWRTKVNIK